jgi:hypothetical protein
LSAGARATGQPPIEHQIPPAQAEQLAAAHAGHERRPPQSVVHLGPGEREEGPYLLDRPRQHLGPMLAARVRVAADHNVLAQERRLSSDGVVQRRPEHDVHGLDRLRRQRPLVCDLPLLVAAHLAVLEEPGVVSAHLPAGERLKTYRAEVRLDVQADRHLVLASRAALPAVGGGVGEPLVEVQEGGDAAEIERWHRQRAHIEERIKEARNGCGLIHLPMREAAANRAWQAATVVAHNLVAMLAVSQSGMGVGIGRIAASDRTPA